ncbi:MAG: glucosaminidase domain-containing protein [Saprospiraceae bacterium]
MIRSLLTLFLLCGHLAVHAQAALSARQKNIVANISTTYGATPEVVSDFVQAAMRVEREKGLPAEAVVGMAILESAGLTSFLFAESKNPFGIKGRKPFAGPVYVMWHEGEDTPFRRYDSTYEAVLGLEAFLQERRWFHDALKCRGDSECFITALMANKARKEPGFSADPEWGNKIRNIIRRFDLAGLRQDKS